MRSRILSVLSLRSGLFFTYGRKYSIKQHRCDAHMNELPVPCGPWVTWYRGRQRFYSQCLVAGAVWWLFSLIMMIWTGSLFLNWGPPLNPGPPSDMIEECEDD